MSLGDVDNDEDNELIIGSLDGTLAIFKGCHRDPWKICSDLGSISCVVVGGITRKSKRKRRMSGDSTR